MIRSPACSQTRRRMTVGLAILAILAFTAGFSVVQIAAAEEPPAAVPKIIAHRGGALLRPENTVPAFRHAAEIGTDILEFDMVMTADDRIIVYHDTSINPAFCKSEETAGVQPAGVRQLRFSDTQRFDCGSTARASYAGSKFVSVPGTRIPELGAMLRQFRDSNVNFFAETKIARDSDVDPVKFAALLAAAVRKNGLEDRLILQSFDYRTVDALHRINPRIRTCLLGVQKTTNDFLDILRQHHASCVVLKRTGVTPEDVRQLKAADILVYSDVIDTAEEWQAYADLGFDAIFTNDPAGAIAHFRGSAARP